MIPVARVLAAAALTAATLTWTPAPHAAAADGDRAVFTGTYVKRVDTGEPDAKGADRTYVVEVVEVYESPDIDTERVTVVSALTLEECGTRRSGVQQDEGAGNGNGNGTNESENSAGTGAPTSTPTDEPTSQTPAPALDRQRRLFDTVFEDGVYRVMTCGDQSVASDADVVALAERFPDHRPPTSDPTPTPEPTAEVTYLCPDDREALPGDLDVAEGCDALASGQAFDRAAAPGLALVIVGVLGLLVARRVGRSKH